MRRLVAVFVAFSVLLGVVSLWVSSSQPAAAQGRVVYWVPVKQEVERGLTRFLERSFQEAEKAGARAIVLEMDTLGGEVNAALAIGKLIRHSDIPVTVYIKGEAISAGSYIALNADHILMAPGSAMGAAEPRTMTGKPADPKTVAFWASNMRAAAEAHGRDPEIAAGMADRNLTIKGLKKKGELVSLSANQAVKLKMADQLATSKKEVLDFVKADPGDVIQGNPSLAEKVARFVTSPYVIPVLFFLGMAGLILEVLTPGFGLPGAIGISAFGLYFFGHYLAGFAGVETGFLLVLGLILMLIEVFVAGFGLFGILGLLSLGASLVSASQDKAFSLGSLLIALVMAGVFLAVVAKIFGVRGTWKKFILADTQRNETGYTSQTGRSELLGRSGQTQTPLRPSGSALIDGVRQDVVSEGEFIPPNSQVKVVDVQGVRVVVRLIKEEEAD
ncbi:NfeD family protein [Salinithrix halophila]|uniref:Nodulation protein NfeD n=1 Tax=Salinithrix halophila TaxID=1485204 RepID=A0ABV8JLA0_9BACL